MMLEVEVLRLVNYMYRWHEGNHYVNDECMLVAEKMTDERSPRGTAGLFFTSFLGASMEPGPDTTAGGCRTGETYCPRTAVRWTKKSGERGIVL
jgi:hypothetical protein